MSISVARMAEWYPGATRRDGPAQKQGYPSAKSPPGGPKKGLVGHSMEGSLAAALGELDNPARGASWTWSNPKVGKLLQHYPASAHTWASGGFQANVDFCPIENEGVAGEPLNQNQIDNLVGLLKWLGPTFGWAGYVRGQTLWEHREMTQFGSAPTACPSGRIPWDTIIAALEDDMSQADVDAINAHTDKRFKELLEVHLADTEAKVAELHKQFIEWATDGNGAPSDGKYPNANFREEVLQRIREIDKGG